MILGKATTPEAERRVLQAKIRSMICDGVKKFVVLAKLEDGRWAFMQTVYEYYDGSRSMKGGEYNLDIVGGHEDFRYVRRRYADRNVRHVRLRQV